jgi:DNA mismatch repair protein MutS2
LQKAEAEKQKVKEKTENILSLHEKIHSENENSTQENLKIGDSVKLVLSGMTGKVSGIEKDKITVVTENMTFRLKRNEIVKIKELIQTRPERSIKSDVELSGKPFQPVLDLRGMRLQEAQEMLDQFIDKALLSNVNRVHVVHGIGNGILKKTVAKSLRNQSYIKSLSHPEEDMGGQSVTIVEFS